MQIGAMNHPARNPIDEIEWIGQHDFDFVDLTLEPPAADPDQIDPQAILAALVEHNLGVVAHTVYEARAPNSRWACTVLLLGGKLA